MHVHLVVLVHGMWGNPHHVEELARIIQEIKCTPGPDGSELRVLVPENNRDDSTYDGIDWGGERVAEEILEQVKRLNASGETVVKFSITGYSLGGLISRYAISILRQKGFFDSVEPVNFNTIASPHLGLLRYPSFLSTLFSTLGPILLSRTGEQFYAVDQWSATGRPLLEVMADPERIFFQALASFKNIRVYANAIHDRTVPYMTAAIEVDDPFADHRTNGIEITVDDSYSPVIASHFTPPPQPPAPKPAVLSPSWFRAVFSVKRKPFLPPFLQFRFPLNIVFYLTLPILIPVFLMLAVVKLALSSRSSRVRIRELEKDAESNGARLISVLSRLEKQVEDAVADAIDHTDPTTSSNKRGFFGSSSPPPEHPVLTPLQQKMASHLNSLPQLQKVLAYFPDVHNAHAVIISRDVKRFEFHRQGEGVIRHWADAFVL